MCSANDMGSAMIRVILDVSHNVQAIVMPKFHPEKSGEFGKDTMCDTIQQTMTY